jgi:hypothetical protein
MECFRCGNTATNALVSTELGYGSPICSECLLSRAGIVACMLSGLLPIKIITRVDLIQEGYIPSES